MSFGFQDVSKTEPAGCTTHAKKMTVFGIPDPMTDGLNSVRDNIGFCHPLEQTEKNYVANLDNMNMAMLKNTQGLHAPLRLAMELKAFENVGRLPFLPSSNLHREVLRGEDDRIDFTDILHPPEMSERMAMPHAVMEHKLGIL
nr:PREDICTED: proteasome maturation protein [Bemisia tabaci]